MSNSDLYCVMAGAADRCKNIEFNTIDDGKVDSFMVGRFYFNSIDDAMISFRCFHDMKRHCQLYSGIDITVVVYGKYDENTVMSVIRDKLYSSYPDKVAR